MHRFIQRALLAILAVSMAVPACAQSDVIARGIAVQTKATTTAMDLTSRLRRAMSTGKLPVAMTSPPTIGSIVTSPTMTRAYAYNSGAFSLVAATWYMDVANSRTIPITSDKAGDGAAYTGGANRTATSGAVEFWTDAPTVEIDCQYDSLRVLVRNVSTNAWEIAATITGGNGSTRNYIPIQFGSSAVRAVKIEATVSTKLYNIRVGPTYTAWPYQDPQKLRAIMLGDSYVGGTGTTLFFTGFCQQLAYLEGIEDWRCSSSGGTGTVQINGSAVNYKDRWIVDVINQGPFDEIIITGSGNDYNVSTATVTANLGTMLDQAHAAFPNALIVVSGSWLVNTNNTNDTARRAVTTAMQSAMSSRPWASFIDMSSWITGTGFAGATTGDGNADRDVGTDDTHPPQAGHDYRASRWDIELRRIVAAR